MSKEDFDAWINRLGIQLDDWQSELLHSSSKRRLVLASRRSGKTYAMAIRCLYRALHEPGYEAIVISPSLNQSNEFLRTVRKLFAISSSPVELIQDASSRLSWTNGARIVSLPGSSQSFRGFGANGDIIFDESAFIEDDVFYGAMALIANHPEACVTLISTPYTLSGFLYDTWQKGDGWERFKVTADKCPRISPEFLEEQRKSLPTDVFKAEYQAEFRPVGGYVFKPEDVEAIFSG